MATATITTVVPAAAELVIAVAEEVLRCAAEFGLTTAALPRKVEAVRNRAMRPRANTGMPPMRHYSWPRGVRGQEAAEGRATATTADHHHHGRLLRRAVHPLRFGHRARYWSATSCLVKCAEMLASAFCTSERPRPLAGRRVNGLWGRTCAFPCTFLIVRLTKPEPVPTHPPRSYTVMFC